MEDGIPILLNLLLVMFLVLLNGFFVASEFALVKVRGSRIAQLVNEGNARAKIAQHVTSRLDAYLSACQLGITLASLGLGWVGEPAISKLIVQPLLAYLNAPEYLVTPVSFGVAFGTITILHIVLGELAPKTIAIVKAEQTALWLSGPLMLFYRLTYPAIWLLNGTSILLLRSIGIQPASEHEASHSEEEIRILMKESQKSGHIDQDELMLVENIFNFSERVAREVMIPRTMVECLYTDSSFDENLDIVIQSKHSRYPLAQEDKDRIIGIIHSMDIYNAVLQNGKDNLQLESMIRPVIHIPEAMEISQVLRVMQKEKVQIVVVVDEYGGTAGIITMEDIMEEIVGDIQDEIKVERAQVEVLEDKTSVDGRLLIEKVNEMLGLDISDEEVDTIGGWIYSQINGQPQIGQTVIFQDVKFQIAEVEHFRIHRVDIYALPLSERFTANEEIIA
ncbi:membrane protein [Paenibacillus sp. J2TS4]|nr:hemolysin family protein [Paenibacillus sp. J2TS4]GIP33923.1 membrane protein [Paenibacillus sp. J2TS4]